MPKQPISLHATTVHSTLWHSPIGLLLLVANHQALCGVWFQDQAGIPAWATLAPRLDQHPLLTQAIQQLQAYFQGQRRTFDLPLSLSSGTPFQQAVWQALQAIPYGSTCSYQSVAQAIGRPSSVRAVGGAVGRNPLGIVLPCHRVLGSNGALTGYTGGLERKVRLLSLEAQASHMEAQ